MSPALDTAEIAVKYRLQPPPAPAPRAG